MGWASLQTYGCYSTLISLQQPQNAWMYSETFESWVFTEVISAIGRFIIRKKMQRKALLITDNRASHPKEKELNSGGVRVIFYHQMSPDYHILWIKVSLKQSRKNISLDFLIVIPVAAWLKAWVCNGLLAVIAGSHHSYECCVLSGRGLCDVLITRPEEPYRVWCVSLSVIRCNNNPIHLQ
jgi:hypothetical protein